MKIQSLTFLFSMGFCLCINAQWVGTNPVVTQSNVGIGTDYSGTGFLNPVEKLTIGELGGNFAVQDRRTATTGVYTSGYKFYDYYGESASILLEHNGYFGNYARAIKFSVNGEEKLRIKASGYVGIGVNPQEKFHLVGVARIDGSLLLNDTYNSSGDKWGIYGWQNNLQLTHRKVDWSYDFIGINIRNDGNVGVGTTEPNNKLEIFGSTFNRVSAIVNANVQNGFQIKRINSNYVTDWEIYNPVSSTDLRFYNNGDLLTIKSTGQIGIGTISPDNRYKLDVIGTIRAREVIVDLNGADFVFEPTYKLRSLLELETFIKEHKHLPEIATAKEMQENGVSAGEMQSKLLQKVEELTLYLIEQEKINKQQAEEIRLLKEEIKRK